MTRQSKYSEALQDLWAAVDLLEAAEENFDRLLQQGTLPPPLVAVVEETAATIAAQSAWLKRKVRLWRAP